jgi:hypothetical protein
MYYTYIMNDIFTLANARQILHTSFYRGPSQFLGSMITHRESYVFDTECKFCAQESEKLVSRVNTRICPDCFSWINDSVGLLNLGIRSVAE